MKLTFHSQKKLFANLQAVFRRNTDDLGKQLLRMKLLAIFLTAACIQVSAKTDAQITINVKDVTLDKVFAEIERQTGMMVMYSFKDLEGTKKVTIKINNASYLDVLKRVFENQPLQYEVKGNSIFIYRQKKSDPAPQAVALAATDKDPLEVTVKVVNEEGEPVAGVTIEVKGGKVAGATDAEGVARIKADPDAVLILTAVNIQSVEKAISGNRNLTIRVIGKTGKLDEVQVIAYGKSSQRLATGSVSTVSGKELELQPVMNPLIGISGRVPGIFITQGSGVAGSGITTLIQGQNSIFSGNEPFYVVDGVPYFQELLNNLGAPILGTSGVTRQSVGNPLSYINPSDIESISVLKGADATAIYGSRAANGAILITTKKGKSGDSRFSISFQQGWGEITRKIDLLNTREYIAMRKEAKKNDNTFITSSDVDLNGFWDTLANHDWQDKLLGQTAKYTNITGTFSGGTSIVQYLLGLTYRKETSVFPGNFSDQKGAMHASITSNSANNKFNLQLNINYLFDLNQLPGADLTQVAIETPSNSPEFLNPDGTLNWALNSSGVSTFRNNFNPLAYTLQAYKNTTVNLIQNLQLEYKLTNDLSIKSSFGYNDLRTDVIQKFPLTSFNPSERPFLQRGGSFVKNSSRSWIIEPQLTYDKNINRINFNVLVGFTVQQTSNNGNITGAAGYISDDVIEDMNSARTLTKVSSTISKYKYNALFTRIGFKWKNQLLLNINARRDGSSRFGSNNRFNNFASAGIGWIFSELDYFKNKISWLSFGKIRSSYGTTGNDQIGDYQFINRFSPMAYPYQDLAGYNPAGISNPYLQWEETRKFEVGMDLGFLKDRILFTLLHFRNKTSNQLLLYELPNTAGFPFVTSNFPATTLNTGFEFVLNAKILAKQNLLWSVNANLTIPKNKLTKFENLENSVYKHALIIGQPISITKVYDGNGVDPSTGQYTFINKNGASTSIPVFPDDRTKIINTAPTFYGGLQSSLSIGQFDCDFLFQFVRQIAPVYSLGRFVGARRLNQPRSVLERWQKAGDSKPVQMYVSNGSLSEQYNLYMNSDEGYADASYIRLKNISLGYRFAKTWLSKLSINAAKMYISCQNILTITNYSGLDPETRGSISSTPLPPLSIATAGIQITF